jgi:hypothetical protein
VVRALHDVGDSHALRFVAREQRLSYADVIDAWIAWDDANPGDEAASYRAKRFLIEFCDRRRVGPERYRGLASCDAG